MRLCVFVWSSLTLPVLGRLKPRSLCEEATSAFVSWPVCLRLHLCVFTWILCAFLELRVSLLTGSVCQEGGGVGGVGGDSGPFETDTRSESESESARERASFMWLCIPPRHRQAEAQDKTCVPPFVTPLHHHYTRPPLCTQPLPLPSVSDLNIYQKAPCWNSFSASVDARVQHVHVLHTYTHILVGTLHGIDLALIV